MAWTGALSESAGSNTESLMLNLAMWKRLSTWTGPISMEQWEKFLAWVDSRQNKGNYKGWDTEKGRRKWAEFKGCETWLTGPPYALREPRKKEEGGTERKAEEIMAEKFSNLVEELNINIQKPQWISSEINSETHIKTHYKQTFKNKREGLPWLPWW